MALAGDALQRIDAYLSRLRRRLRGMNDEGARDIVEELRGHITDKASASGEVTAATVEAALLDAPMVVVYRVTPLTAALARPLVRTKFFSMVNLIAERRVVPELIQEDFTPEKVAGEAVRLLQDANARRAMRDGLAEVRQRLGPPGAVDRAADAILALVNQARQ